MALQVTAKALTIALFLAALVRLPNIATAAPPPDGSPTAQAIGPFSEWIRGQELPAGVNWRIGCCSDADGGVVEYGSYRTIKRGTTKSCSET